MATVKPSPTEMQQSATVNLPPHLTRILVVPAIPDHLQNQQPNERAFEAMLHPGVNVVEAHLIAAIPRNERVPGGPEVELEVFTIFINVLRN